MELEEATPARRGRFTWIWVVLALAFIGMGVFITREPASPYPFLNNYPVAEKRTSKDGKLRVLVLQADAKKVWDAVRAEFAKKSAFTSTGYMNINGQATQYMSIATEEGVIKVSDDLTFADEGFGVTIQKQHVKPGYCAVAFTRPPTILDKFMDWVRDRMGGGSKPQMEDAPPPAAPTTIRV